MARLSRFEDHRYVGTRDDMCVYDCDDEDQFEILSRRVQEENLMNRKLLQGFGADSLPEARNRGYKPV